jgi:hypothetical protein
LAGLDQIPFFDGQPGNTPFYFGGDINLFGLDEAGDAVTAAGFGFVHQTQPQLNLGQLVRVLLEIPVSSTSRTE